VRGVFVTGTDTGAGKSVVAAAICAACANPVAALKPVVTERLGGVAVHWLPRTDPVSLAVAGVSLPLRDWL
jgi:dethiobiotin synthetase